MGDVGSIPGLGRSPGEGKGYPLQYSGLENSMDPWGLRESDRTEPLSLSFSFKNNKNADNTTRMAESKEELKSLMMK